MDFIDELRQFASKISGFKDKLLTEEATKQSIILPFIQLLGYNIFDPHEVIPEFTADVGIKKGEKVDYAIMIDGKPSILIEAKPINDPLTSHDSQLYRYFTTTEAKFAILTNGIFYKFYSDIQETNKMDDSPFLEINLLDIKETLVPELKKFMKASYDADELFSSATILKYAKNIKATLDAEMKDPSEDFIRHFIKSIYSGKITQNVLERFKPIVKRALGQYLNELINDKIKTAIDNTIASEQEAAPTNTDEIIEQSEERKIVTTNMETEGYFIIKTMLHDVVDPKRITYKDTLSYFGVLLDGNTWKWICRLFVEGSKKYLVIPINGKEVKHPINDIEDIYKFKTQLEDVVNSYLK